MESYRKLTKISNNYFHKNTSKTPRKLPKKPTHSEFNELYHQKRIVVKFVEHQKIRPLQNFLLRLENSINIDAENELNEINSLFDNSDIQAERLFQRTEEELNLEYTRLKDRSPIELEDLNAYLQVNVYHLQAIQIEEIIDRLNQSSLVEIAYPMGKTALPILGGEPYDMGSATPLLTSGQGYLGPAPTGLNVSWAKATSPYNQYSRGGGIKLTDMEFGWDLDHEDYGFRTYSNGIPTFNLDPVINFTSFTWSPTDEDH